MAALEIDQSGSAEPRARRSGWTKVQVRCDTEARLRAWFLAVYPDPAARPPMREAAELLMGLALDGAEAAVKPEPTPLAKLAALRNER